MVADKIQQIPDLVAGPLILQFKILRVDVCFKFPGQWGESLRLYPLPRVLLRCCLDTSAGCCVPAF